MGYYPFYIGANHIIIDGILPSVIQPEGMKLVKPPLGTTVKHLPAGAKVTVIDGVKYYELGGTYY